MAIPLRKTLFIGIGGFGKATLRSLRRKFYETYGFFRIPALQYLVLDTDKDPAARSYRVAYDGIDGQVSFDQNQEFIDLSIDRGDLESIYQGTMTQRVKDALAWLDPRLKDLGTNVLEDGAGGIRAFGKLALLLALMRENSPVETALGEKLRYLHNLTNVSLGWEEVKERFCLDEADRQIDVVLACSTAGGTGSGVFLDLAYLVRYAFSRRIIDQANAASIGDVSLYLYLPDVILEDEASKRAFHRPSFLTGRSELDPRKLVNSGSYAALAELERFQLSRHEEFAFDGGTGGSALFVPDWEPFADQHTRTGVNEMFRGQRPFNWVYLIGSMSTNNQRLASAEDGIDMTADKLFTLLVEQDQKALIRIVRSNRSMFVLPDAFKSDDGRYTRVFARHYGGFGVAKVFIGESLIKRWAAYYLADKFLTSVLEAEPETEANANDGAAAVWDAYHWSPGHLVGAFATEVFGAVRDAFRSLRNDEAYIALVRRGVGDRHEDECFGKASVLDRAWGAWHQRFSTPEYQKEFLDTIERWTAKSGLGPACQVLDAGIARVTREISMVKAGLDAAKLADMTEECRTWFRDQNATLDWLGASCPQTADGLPLMLVPAQGAVAHLRELRQIPTFAAERVRAELRTRFFDRFLHVDCCRAWRDALVRDDAALEKTASSLDGLQTGLLRMFNAVLGRVLAAQEEIQRALQDLRQRLQQEAPQANTLQRSLKDLREREDGSKGIKPELATLSRPRPRETRNVYCGTPFQQPEQLLHPDPDGQVMVELLRHAFGKHDASGLVTPLPRIWDLVDAPELETGSNQWIGLVLGRGLADLKQPPDLDGYYRQRGNQRDQQLQEDVKHVLDTSASHLRYSQHLFGEARRPLRTGHLFVPNVLLEEVRRLPKIEATGYLGKEIVAITIEDGIPLVLTDLLPSLREAYRDFSWPKAVWTRPEAPLELTPWSQQDAIRGEAILGILLGVIWYDRQTASFKMPLENRHYRGVFEPVPLGKTPAEVVAFFSREQPHFLDAGQRLMEVNVERLADRLVLRKINPLLSYYQKYYLAIEQAGDQSRRPGDYFLLMELLSRRAVVMAKVEPDDDARKKLNQEAIELAKWLHVFCELVPRQKVAPGASPESGDWMPVLMRGWQTARARETILWHNRRWPPPTGVAVHGLMAMDARPDQYTEGSSLSGWDEQQPQCVPADVHQLAWGTPGKSPPKPTTGPSTGGGSAPSGTW